MFCKCYCWVWRMIDSLYYSGRGGVKTLLWITKWITKSFVIHYERFERTHFVRVKWISNHCASQKHHKRTAMIKHVNVAAHLIVGRTEFALKFRLLHKYIFSCPASPAVQFYTGSILHIKHPIYFNKKREK